MSLVRTLSDVNCFSDLGLNSKGRKERELSTRFLIVFTLSALPLDLIHGLERFPTNGVGMSQSKRVAMWSGPRTISTAMMRAWGQRPDTAVCDEPFYAYYLKETGRKHPAADTIIAQHESDPQKVIEWITGPPPDGKQIFFQKHMAQHILPELDRLWFGAVDHALLIRSPEELILSLRHNVPDLTAADTGFPQLLDIYRHIEALTGAAPPVVLARDVLDAPGSILAQLCTVLGVAFSEEMLSWPSGPRETDGVWAPHWYSSVEQSTGFEPYVPKTEPLPEKYSDVLEECRALFDALAEHRIRPQAPTRAKGD